MTVPEHNTSTQCLGQLVAKQGSIAGLSSSYSKHAALVATAAGGLYGPISWTHVDLGSLALALGGVGGLCHDGRASKHFPN